MRTKTIRLFSVVMAGGLIFTGVAVAASSHTGHVANHAVLAADKTGLPPVNLDNCPTLAEGYHGGCIDQLQTELNAIEGLNLSVDGTFGQDTFNAVKAFQGKNGLKPDGMVGPATKQALDNDWSSVPTPTPGPALPAQTPAPSTAQPPAPSTTPPAAPVWATPGFVSGEWTSTIYFNQSQTDYFDSDESQACALFAAATPIPGVGEIGDLLAGACEAQWKVVELEAYRAEQRGMCLKIKFATWPTLAWWPDIYRGRFCT